MLNWAGPYAGAAPRSVSMPDDHEYWNNFPHAAPLIQNSWQESSRENWRRAARAAFEGFQRQYPAESGEAVIIDVDPLSFSLADTRTDKDPDRKSTMSSNQRRRLDDWFRA